MIFVIKLAFFSLHSPNVKLRSDIKCKVSTYKNILLPIYTGPCKVSPYMRESTFI